MTKVEEERGKEKRVELKCCGANSFEDWRRSAWLMHTPLEKRLVPDSCCKTEIPMCGKSDHPSNIPYTGCIHSMTDRLEHQLWLLGAVGLGMCALPVFGMIFNCCLYIKLKDFIDD
ncbi:CD151 antigen-like [Ctenocephalides felis]|uniref:CD151 antigen-like n=1 Tax=Ctenocephalides felis TaxID=7515 RepID=UPI000E6E10BC|nr:CD151 antigen-like [Ctenocephalides felis]